tara:strand:- start:2822 stop:3625 length:804 start_codon:yes stop_codon:yes gene_type:complete
MTKSADKESSMDTMNEKILAVLETPAANEAALDEMILKEELSEDAVRAVRAALRLLDAFRDEIPSDTLNGLADAAGMDRMEEETNPEKGDEDDMDKGYKMRKEDDVLKSADLPEELKPHLEQLWKSNEEYAARVSELENVLKTERDERLMKSETERISKSFGHVPGADAASVASLLIEVRKSNPDHATAIEDLLAATEQAMVAKSDGAFEETGTSTTEVTTGSAWGRIEGLATELVQKGEAANRAKAIDQVLIQNPELYAEYLSDKD